MSTTTWTDDIEISESSFAERSAAHRLVWWGGAVTGAILTNSALLVSLLYLFSVLE